MCLVYQKYQEFMHSLDDLKHGYYINLEHRKDRRAQAEEELARIGLQDRVSRFNAVEMKNGRIGCTLSHLRCLEQAREQKLPHVLICEDDIHFLSPGVFTENLNKFLMLNLHWDVILLAGNNMPPYTRVNECCVKVTQCQTTTGYIVSRHYYDTLIENIRAGLKMMISNPDQHFHYAIDKYWFVLQRVDRWFLITPLSVVQREGYSDIEKKNTNFSRAMIDLDKEEFLRRMQERISRAPLSS